MQTTFHTTQKSLSSVGIVWLRMAVIYLILGVTLGIAMGASEDFTLRPVHAHINLLGWATMALAGLVYSVYPHAGMNRLAKLHFWMTNLALPVMMIALTLLLLGQRAAIPFLAASEIVAALGIVSFAFNIFLNLKKN
ncbi:MULTISPECIES: cbb3-type cytochrome c oxidase subunit I [Oxalobacteraceae]|uniref:cbb3-type cytochrome c oxidase subunit I n=1 Tax=Oxalobacteraceae TaxID=75682 RepID=UPI0010A31D13|nr:MULTISPECIES: cbb3-type cytochrome c oxidase subunit I [Oxalobacteraceae]